MNRKTTIFLSVAVLALASLACNALLPLPTPESNAPTQSIEPTVAETENQLPVTEASVPRVSVEDAKIAFDNGEAIIVDVRSSQAFENSHVAGAINIPLGAVENNPTGLNLDKEQWIITYCT